MTKDIVSRFWRITGFSLTRKEKGSKSLAVCINSSVMKEIYLYLEFSDCVARKKAHVLYFAFERHLLNYFVK